jgi:hypothetical protein
LPGARTRTDFEYNMIGRDLGQWVINATMNGCDAL